MQRRRVFILGSTGSIGTSALDVVRDFARRTGAARGIEFEIVGLAAARNGGLLGAQAREFNAQAVAVVDDGAALDVPAGTRVFRGPDAACEMLAACARRGAAARTPRHRPSGRPSS